MSFSLKISVGKILLAMTLLIALTHQLGMSVLAGARADDVLKPRIILIPGAGAENENLYLGYIRWGDYFTESQKVLKKLGYDSVVVPALDRGNQSVLERVENLKVFLNQQLLELKPGQKFILMGHSLGGLVGRVVLRDRSYWPMIQKVVTLHSPHYGTALASWLLENESKAGMQDLVKLLGKLVGFNLDDKRYIEEMTHQGSLTFDTALDHLRGAPTIFSVAGARCNKKFSIPLMAIGDQIIRRQMNECTDGVIELSSQIWDQNHALIVEQDHGSIIGKSLSLRPSEVMKPLKTIYFKALQE
jgi:hypothetical protein